MNYLFAYSVVFAAGYLSCMLGVWLIGVSWDSGWRLGLGAGLAAALSALLITKLYLSFLQAGKQLKLYLLTVAGVLLSHLLFGFIMALPEQYQPWNAFIVYMLTSVFLGIISNLVFSFCFTTILIQLQKRHRAPSAKA